MFTVQEFFETPESIFIWVYLENKESREKIDPLAVSDLFIEITISFKYIIQSIFPCARIYFEPFEPCDGPWQVFPDAVLVLIWARIGEQLRE